MNFPMNTNRHQMIKVQTLLGDYEFLWRVPELSREVCTFQENLYFCNLVMVRTLLECSYSSEKFIYLVTVRNF